MKRISILLMALVSVIFFTGCPGHEPEYIDLGTIPEKYYATVPYQDGDVFYLQHENDRVVIPFNVTRYRASSQGDNVYGFDNYDLSKFKPAPSVYFNYEVDVTTCKPDYPLFGIEIHFSNGYMADSVYYPNYDPMSPKYAQLTVQNLMYASFPFIGEPTDKFTVLDSLEVNGHTYYNVFEFINQNQYQDKEDIHAKSLYYNYEKGVIAIYMSNGEKYMLYENE